MKSNKNMYDDGEKMERNQRIKLLLHIIDKLHSKGDRNGETNIQKLAYFIIKAKLAPLDYDYVLYNYGPYSFQLKDDLTYIEESRMVCKEPDSSGFGFKYIPNYEMDFVDETLKETRFQSKIDQLIIKFRQIPAKNLGLIATYMYIYDKNQDIDDENLINAVHNIKPMFNKFELENMLKEHNDLIKGNIEEFLMNCSY